MSDNKDVENGDGNKMLEINAVMQSSMAPAQQIGQTRVDFHSRPVS